jgi:hypothetical protein
MNHILKTVVLSGALVLCTMLFGCGSLSPSSDPGTEGQTSSALSTQSGSVCDMFCQSQGGAFYRMTSATSETACTQQLGDWFTADQGYPGPPPGCCCKCTLASGNCL